MVFERQLNAVSGMVMLSGILFMHADALAFGQQWRPAPGYGAAAAGPGNRAANMPSFRPSAVARQSLHRSHSRIGHRPYRQRSHRFSSHGITGAQRYPLPRATNPHALGLHLPQPGYFSGAYPGPGLGTPFTGMAEHWRQPAPLFARQYAWRPAAHPWVARAPVSPRAGYPVHMAPQFVGYGPTGAAYSPPAGSWRPPVWQVPASYPQLSYQRRVMQRPVYAAYQQPGSHRLRPAAPPVPGNRVAGPPAVPVGPGAGFWRPHAATPATSWHSGQEFRPQEYGRNLAADKEEASGTGQDLGFTRDSLPGWVTTYQDSGYESSCAWCYGS